MWIDETLPERDQAKPAEQQGLFRKFDVRRVDGSDAPGGKHHGCRYFVLDLDHDQHAPAAMAAYAKACRATHPVLSAEIDAEYPQPSGVPFGVIDPDYARIYTQARIIAWTYGYSCSAQGSFTRDLDLLLVPWTDTAKQNIDQVVTHLASVCDLRIHGAPSEKPHGRRAWTLLLPGFGECRWVDLSAFAPAQEAKSGD